MFHFLVAAAFQKVGKADQIRIDIGVRIDERVADTGLRRKIHDRVEPLHGEQLFHRQSVGDIQTVKAEAGLFLQPPQPRLLERHLVIVVEIVDAGNFVSAREQRLREVKADEAGSACDQYLHSRSVNA